MERDAQWRRSSYSGSSGGECVEVADLGVLGVGVRDSKNPGGGVLTVSSEAYVALKDWATMAAKA
ncbi:MULTISPECIES: DUF397 domain-containing protein [Streptomyces]|uniref:DUF397 domain-containing protein n=1 Tax=Streptomyces koelreuteriae TaxID=2838015 RepID=A0ABX8FT31_9ACTN|nr:MULTISPECIES: DUF397 domain-containing protein [Streptomyces]QWB24350.1 DUF397 domain-containing protein [Streptomyces koelreuteriae]UUA07352.1 DUF397 domain-containing protein [Streptomyces koelreuteriae]UUA14981.1 DUF397 domain-containing protein [Streptomyces sp. CRCS-T-1]